MVWVLGAEYCGDCLEVIDGGLVGYGVLLERSQNMEVLIGMMDGGVSRGGISNQMRCAQCDAGDRGY